jgi:hypothetical protein
MISRSKTKKTLFAGLVAATAAFAWTAPAEAQWGYGGWRGGYGGGGFHHRHFYRPIVRRTVVVERPYVVRPPVIRRTVIVERPIVRPVFAHRTVVVERPVYVRRVVRRPVYWREARFIDRPWHGRRWHGRWHDRPRCWLPERYLCR